ncbi:hypothetical protein TNCV_2884321 [Trichonephila clavipes]|nr:hypothetical protein TNCV_2884321 [Trichonephila clavipes]
MRGSWQHLCTVCSLFFPRSRWSVGDVQHGSSIVDLHQGGRGRAMIRLLFGEDGIPEDIDTSHLSLFYYTLNDDDSQWLTLMDCLIFRHHI